MSITIIGAPGRKITARHEFVKYLVDGTCKGVEHIDLLSNYAEVNDEMHLDGVKFTMSNATKTRNMSAQCMIFNTGDVSYTLTLMAHGDDGDDYYLNGGGSTSLEHGFTEVRTVQ
jgi:hypothetical protein